MLKQTCKIGCCVLMMGLLSVPTWNLGNDANGTPGALVVAHGGDGPADGSGNGAPDGAGTCPDDRIESGSLLVAGGRARTGLNSRNTVRTRTRQHWQQRTPGVGPAKVRQMNRTTVRKHN